MRRSEREKEVAGSRKFFGFCAESKSERATDEEDEENDDDDEEYDDDEWKGNVNGNAKIERRIAKSDCTITKRKSGKVIRTATIMIG